MATTTPGPSAVEGVGFPVHVLAINALGLHLLDYLHLEELLALCETPTPLVIPVRDRTAPAPVGDRLTGQPHRDLLTRAVYLS